MKIQLGMKAKDKITGFEGTITGHARYITGCDQYLLMPQAKDGKQAEGGWYDEHRLEITNEHPIRLAPPETTREFATAGADIPAPIK